MKQAEESLRTSEKLAAVGRMSGTLAHEINNPLDAVNNLVYLLLQDSKLDEHGRECVQLLQRELERMQHIVANTLSFYRDSSLPVQVNLSQVLDSVLTLDARKIERKQLRVSKRIEANVLVMGFPGELRQVFLNLVSNAIEATPDRGKLRIHIFPSRQWQERRGSAESVWSSLITVTVFHLNIARSCFSRFSRRKANKERDWDSG